MTTANHLVDETCCQSCVDEALMFIGIYSPNETIPKNKIRKFLERLEDERYMHEQTIGTRA